MLIFTSVLLIASLFFFCWKRLLTYCHIFQQEEYYNIRFLQNLVKRRLYDKRGTLIIGVAALLSSILGKNEVIFSLIHGAAALLLAWAAYVAKNPATQAKKPLVLTSRVKRLLGATGVLVIATTWYLFHQDSLGYYIFLFQLIPLYIICANLCLTPVEKLIHYLYLRSGLKRLEELSPQVIAVGGSFGKTSAKYFLQYILNSAVFTAYTPGSVNTLMGITKFIRTTLTKAHKYFVIEVAAYHLGSIARLCKAFKPTTAIVTAIGIEHFERFKSFEAIESANLELPEYCLEHGGHVVTTEDVLNNPKFQASYRKNKDHYTIVGIGPLCDIQIISAENTRQGLNITLGIKGKEYSLQAPIYGRHHAFNIALAIGAALYHGLNLDLIILALAKLPQVKNRLEVKPFWNGATLIDDGYNSNPLGFEEALNVMDTLTQRPGRRILVTPGLVELGVEHDEVHYKLGQKAAANADVIIIVSPTRIPTFVKAVEEGMPPEAILQVESFKHAVEWLKANTKKGDTILFENDLPDLYEDTPVL